MGISISDLLLRIRSDKGGAQTDVEALAASLEALDHTKAEATATVDTQKEAFDQLKIELDKFDHERFDAKVGIDTQGAQAQLELFTRALDNMASRTFTGKFFGGGGAGEFTQLLPHGGQMTIPVDLDTGKAQAEAIALHEQLKLELGHETVNVDVDRSAIQEGVGVVDKLTNAFSSLATSGAGVGKWLGDVASNLGTVTVNFGMFGARLGPVLIILLAVAFVLGVSIVGALGAVAASAIAAATALGAMGIALVGALAPIALIAIPAFLIFGRVLQALTSQGTAAKQVAANTRTAAQAIQQKVQADQQARTYAEQHAAAVDQVSQAMANMASATKSATREMQDAIQHVTDSILALRDAQDAAAQSKLDFRKAKQDLKDFLTQMGASQKQIDAFMKTFTDVAFDPTKLNRSLSQVKAVISTSVGGTSAADNELQLLQLIQNVKTARDHENDATNNVKNSETQLKRARQDAQPFLENGIKASQTYQGALKQLHDAEKNLAQLESDHAFQLKENAILQAANAKSQQAALAATTTQTQKLTGESKKLYDAIKSLKDIFMQTFGPAVNSFINGFINGFKFLEPGMKNLKGPIGDLGKAMGTAVTDFFKAIGSPQGQKLFEGLIKGAQQLTPYVNKVILPILDILGKIATAVLPLITPLAKSVADSLGKWDKGLTIKDIKKFIEDMIPSLKQWVSFAVQLIPSFFQLVRDVAPYGDKLVKWVTGVAKQLFDWASSKKGRDEIHDFFHNTIPLVETFMGDMIKVMGIFISIYNFMDNIYNAVKKVFDIIGTVFSTLEQYGLQDPFQFVWDSIKNLLGIGKVIDFFNFGKRIVMDIVHGIESIDWSSVGNWFSGGFKTVEKFFTKEIPKWFNSGVKLINGIWDGIKSIGLDIAGWVSGHFDDAINFLKGLPDRLYKLGGDLLGDKGLWGGIKGIVFDVKNWLVNAFHDAITYLKNLPNTMYDLGKNIALGLWHGLESVAKSIGGFFLSIVEAPVNLAKKVLHVHSPSLVMMDIGRDVMKGYQMGLEAGATAVNRSLIAGIAAPIAAAGVVQRGITIQNQNVNLPAAPGHNQMGDPRHQAALFAREMQRRGWR